MKIGIDIGGSHIAIATINRSGQIVEKIEENIEAKEDISQYIVNYVDKGIEKLSKNAEKIEEIGIAAPGNPKGTIISNLVNLGIDIIDLKTVENKYHIKIKSINDAKAAAIAEKTYGAMKNYRDCVFLCLGTGIGGAVFLNQQLLKPNRNPGFEFGHMVINEQGILCNCGKQGCFETYCSMKRLKERVKEKLKEIYHGEKIEDISDAIIVKRLLEQNRNHIEIQKIVDEYIYHLQVGLSNIVDIFEPEAICLGGSFVYFKDILYEKLVSQMDEKRYVFNKQSIPKIVLADLKNDAGMIGATLI